MLYCVGPGERYIRGNNLAPCAPLASIQPRPRHQQDRWQLEVDAQVEKTQFDPLRAQRVVHIAELGLREQGADVDLPKRKAQVPSEEQGITLDELEKASRHCERDCPMRGCAGRERIIEESEYGPFRIRRYADGIV